MLRERAVVAASLAILLCSFSPLRAARGTSTPDERALVAARIRALESVPLDKKAAEQRTVLLKWVVEVPDVSVDWCSGLLLEASKADKELGGALLVQAILSATAFVIESPGEASDPLAVSRAGIRGALNAYRVTIEAKPRRAVAFLDDLAEKDAAGRLDEYITPKLVHCK